jgi:hypothetical protein
MTQHAQGPFEVQTTPTTEDSADPTLGRLILLKQFRGDLEGVGAGQMLTAGTDVPGSAAYVAIERVAGTLHGRKGSFVLQHVGILNRGDAVLNITIVPDSGTDELQGIAGTLTITNDNGTHSYDLDYMLDETA